jgi:hypothetical protein
MAVNNNVLHIWKSIRKDLESFHYKEMINVLGDRYMWPDLNTTQFVYFWNIISIYNFMYHSKLSLKMALYSYSITSVVASNKY